MNNLMDELMAEIKRVNALEVEVVTSIKNTMLETNMARTEKAKEIFAFLAELRNALKSAGMMQYSSSYCNVETNIANSDGCYKWKYNLQIHQSENYFIVTFHNGHPSKEYVSFDMTKNYIHAKYVIDHWDDETYTIVRNEVAKKIKEHLSKRVEDATTHLRDANQKHAIYFGKEV